MGRSSSSRTQPNSREAMRARSRGRRIQTRSLRVNQKAKIRFQWEVSHIEAPRQAGRVSQPSRPPPVLCIMSGQPQKPNARTHHLCLPPKQYEYPAQHLNPWYKGALHDTCTM